MPVRWRGLVLGWCFCLTLLCQLADGLRHGEHVPMSKRSQYNEMRTEWGPVLREWCPRFSEDSEVELPSVRAPAS
jgi:hypothetical protein